MRLEHHSPKSLRWSPFAALGGFIARRCHRRVSGYMYNSTIPKQSDEAAPAPFKTNARKDTVNGDTAGHQDHDAVGIVAQQFRGDSRRCRSTRRRIERIHTTKTYGAEYGPHAHLHRPRGDSGFDARHSDAHGSPSWSWFSEARRPIVLPNASRRPSCTACSEVCRDKWRSTRRARWTKGHVDVL